MEVKIKQIPDEEPEILEIRYHRLTDEIGEIISFVKSGQGQLAARKDGRDMEVPVVDVFYAESVDNRVFLYTAKESFEVRMKLYELEEKLRGRSFIRVQKSTLLNLMKIEGIKPALGGRYSAMLKNGEEILISRKYVTDLKNALINPGPKAGGKA